MAADNKQSNFLAQQAREQFAGHAARILPELSSAVRERLSALAGQIGNAREMQEHRDAWLAFQQNEATWIRGTLDAWRKALVSPPASAKAGRLFLNSGKFELMGNEVMENKILASRLALRLLDVASWELNDLRLRVQNLDGTAELSKDDILRPEVLTQHLVEQWTLAPLSREVWLMVQDVIQKQLAAHLLEAYHAANEFLIGQGVMAEIDLRPLVKRTPSAAGGAPMKAKPVAGAQPKTAAAAGDSTANSRGSSGDQGGAPMGVLADTGPTTGNGSGGTFGGGGHGDASAGTEQAAGGGSGGAFGGSQRGSQGGAPMGAFADAGRATGGGSGGTSGGGGVNSRGLPGGGHSGAAMNAPAGASGVSGGGSGGAGGSSGAGATTGRNAVHDETRMQTATTPLARARMKAQGVMGHLKRLLTDHAGYDDTRANPPSPQLAQALAKVETAERAERDERAGGQTLRAETSAQVYGQADVEQAASALRQRTNSLKQAASTSSEKATIEIVALMFQSILAEDRIPPAIRVWFARLQMPVLRVAISEPEFFGSLQHPARRLIDRMGSCVLGFDAAVSGGALETEIKRVVQVIEQYPETGRRVFQLVYDEFQKFLSKFLSEQGSAARVVSVAQQVEQKETMVIQYTIEMRSMLNDMPVREEIREFLFKIWAEVLAIAAMRNGPQHPETVTLKQAAADLVWAASAKPNRNDRARVIADLPKLLQLLRQGMAMLGMEAPAQDGRLKVISATLADAFMSKTDAIPAERIDVMAKRLANLEDYLSDEDVGDLPLDTENLVMMIGIDAADIQIITDGGSHPSEAMRAWVKELQLGAWFSLDHNGKVSHVQFAWCSDRKQLHLFASADGRNFLIQARRLAAYLQAGLLVPTEEEALTVRATRDALGKLDANPERLLG
ncbi:DUF1631 family protein [Polaromonas sp.]|uniref:DUF1631 family protein n=1 Tax=Polaromonas sp. TaxID=1869339 RepID=UPI002FC8F9FC